MQVNRKRKSEACSVCNVKLNGRKDQVFCGRECQNVHHKETKEALFYSEQLSNKRLIRNCVILEGILTDNIKKVSVHRDALFQHGFDSNSFENESWKGNKRIRYIGPFSFWLLKNGMIQIKRRKKSWITNQKVLKRWEVEFLWLIEKNVVVYTKQEIDNVNNNGDYLTVIPFIYNASHKKTNSKHLNLDRTHNHLKKSAPS
ncbi:MAG: hypothetical protein ACPGU5_06315 [Lishizhenia sp.]